MKYEKINTSECTCNIEDKIKYEGYVNINGDFVKKYKCLLCNCIWYKKPSIEEEREFNGI